MEKSFLKKIYVVLGLGISLLVHVGFFCALLWVPILDIIKETIEIEFQNTQAVVPPILPPTDLFVRKVKQSSPGKIVKKQTTTDPAYMPPSTKKPIGSLLPKGKKNLSSDNLQVQDVPYVTENSQSSSFLLFGAVLSAWNQPNYKHEVEEVLAQMPISRAFQQLFDQPQSPFVWMRGFMFTQSGILSGGPQTLFVLTQKGLPFTEQISRSQKLQQKLKNNRQLYQLKPDLYVYTNQDVAGGLTPEKINQVYNHMISLTSSRKVGNAIFAHGINHLVTLLKSLTSLNSALGQYDGSYPVLKTIQFETRADGDLKIDLFLTFASAEDTRRFFLKWPLLKEALQEKLAAKRLERLLDNLVPSQNGARFVLNGFIKSSVVKQFLRVLQGIWESEPTIPMVENEVLVSPADPGSAHP